jgi:hypothetical protein
MSDKDNGGNAFPCMPPQDTAAGAATGYPFPDAGMSMRDYFAAKTLQGGIATAQGLGGLNQEELAQAFGEFARICYAAADAMLKERSK